MKAKTLSSCILLLAIAACQQLESTAASVAFSVTPSAVSNTYNGTITLQVTGLTNGETVVVQKFLDANTNGVIDASDWLVQQFSLTDGQAGMAIGGIVNSNVPGDTDSTAGQITAQLNFQNGDFMQNVAGQYAFKLSSPGGHFASITNLFSVTNVPYAQKFTGNVVSNRTSTTLPNAMVLLFGPPRPGKNGPGGPPLAGALANNAGSYTIPAPPGTYMVVAFKGNYLGDFSMPPILTLGSGQTLTTNLTLTNATSSISGSLVDANNSGIGLPGILLSANANSGLMGVGFTDTNGNFILGVQSGAGQWGLSYDDTSLIVHGYVGLQNKTNVNAGQTNVTLAVPKATALFYGNVKDGLGNPLPGIDVYAYDNNQLYQTDSYTDANGKYAAGVLGGLGGNDPWSLQISSDTNPTNYIFSQPAFAQAGGTNISAGTAVQVKFTALLATNHITGWLKDNNGNPIAGVGVSANATINGADYNQGGASTDSNGNYWLNVANGTWTVGVSTCSGCSDGLPGNDLPPANQTVVITNNNGIANFTALLATNHVSGWLKDNSGNPITGIMVWASATINSVNYFQSVNTDASGNYSLGLINGSWMVGVEQGSGGNGLPGNYLAPANQSVVIANNNGTANFTALTANYHISGWLKDNNGNPIVGIGVWANATINGVDYNQGTVDTDAGGNYSLSVANGTWSVGVNSGGGGDSLPGSYLSPANQTVVIANNNGTANFSALLATNQISGYVTNAANLQPLANVGVYAYANINGVNYNAYMDTDGNGHYAFNVGSGSWHLGLNCSGGASDSLEWLGFQCVSEQGANIVNNNALINFTVQPSASLQITTGSLPPGTVGTSYNQSLIASGGQPPYNWWLPGGTSTLPPGTSGGMSFSSDGTISGTPSTPGTYTFWVGVYDSASPQNIVTQQVSLTISKSGADVVDYYVSKMEYFTQLDLANTVLNTNPGPFIAYLGLVQSAVGSVPLANVTLPGSSQRALPMGSSGIKLQTQERFTDQASIDTAYPPGNYTFSLFAVNDGARFPVLSMPPATYPNPPHVSNFGTAQAINPLAPFTLQWDTISGATTNDSIWVLVTDATGVVFSTPDPATDHAVALQGTATSVIVPASTFQPGHAYTGWITYSRTTSLNQSAYPGAAGVTTIGATTSFPLALNSGAPRLDQAIRLSDTQFRFQLSGTVGQTYSVQASTNLASTNWFTLMTTNLSASPALIQDNQATAAQRFYRVKVGP